MTDIGEINTYQIKSGILGHCVGDALGVPVEFKSRDVRRKKPVTDMQGFGSHQLPEGTWSDDTSMTLCLIDSLTSNNLDYADIMKKFHSWAYDGYYTPYGKMFGIGQVVLKAMFRYERGSEPLECGGNSERDNGNGSLMRILPIVFYLKSEYGESFSENRDAYSIIHNISSLTHAHAYSKIACGMYISIAGELMKGQNINDSILIGIDNSLKYYRSSYEFSEFLIPFNRVIDQNFSSLSLDEIRSTGYVVDSLESALWCLLNTDDYSSCVLRAVNLGGDTDTIAAIAGGLAGITYGFDDIPKDWINKIVKLEYIYNLCEKFALSLM